MSSSSNGCAELTRFWLQERHQCLIDDELPVPVPYALSDIDLVALRADGAALQLPAGPSIGPRLIVESKAEHDWDPTGREFGLSLTKDVEQMAGGAYIPADARGVKFTMLRQQHFERATSYFGTDAFDRLFVVHALDEDIRLALTPFLESRRVFWLTLPELLADIYAWYHEHPRKAALRRSLTGDLLHILFGVGGFEPPGG